MAIKTKAFKLGRLSKGNLTAINHQLSALRWVWNEGLRLLEAFDAFTGNVWTEQVGGKKIYHYAPCCPVPWRYRKVDKNKPWEEGNFAPYTYFAGKKPHAQFCPLQPSCGEAIATEVTTEANKTAIHWLEEEGVKAVAKVTAQSLNSGVLGVSKKEYEEFLEDNPDFAAHSFIFSYKKSHDPYRKPKLANSSYFSLCKYFAQKNHRDKPWFTCISANFVRGTCKSLSKSWDRWKAGKGGKPKFKSAKFPLKTLLNEDAKKTLVTKIDSNDRDGSITIPKLGTFRVKHLWKDWGDRVPSVMKIVREADGCYLQLTGEFEDKAPPETTRKCILTAPKRTSPLLGISDTGKEYKAYSPDPKLLKKKEALQQQLSRQQYLSKRWEKTRVKLGRVNKLLARQASSYNQKLSTFTMRTYAHIELDGVGKKRVIKKPRKKEKAKTLDPIVFDPNGAAAVADYNRNLLSQRSGQFVQLVKAKGKAMGRQVTERG